MNQYQVWQCKIGVKGDIELPAGSDWPMRVAIQKAFFELTGVEAEFTFSGWNAQLTEGEKAVAENKQR
jgi:hypothetical protein